MSVVPTAISRLGNDDSREAQTTRAVRWLVERPGGPIVVVTPRRDFEGQSLKQLISAPGVTHHAWRGFRGGDFSGRRVLYAWPDRKHLNDVWAVEADAIVVIEWNEAETAEWVTDARPIQLLPGETIGAASQRQLQLAPLPNGVDAILEYVAAMAAGYATGLKWDEEDKLKADMMNRPERWDSISVEQVRAKCRQLEMRAADVDTIAGYLQRRKDGRRFNVRSSYRTFEFD